MKILIGLLLDSFRDYLFNETMQTNDSLVMFWHCWGGLWCQFIGGVYISIASPKYLQPERVISGSCNYPPGLLPSDPSNAQSVVLDSPSILAYMNEQSFIPCHGSLSIVYSSLPFPPPLQAWNRVIQCMTLQTRSLIMCLYTLLFSAKKTKR